MENEKKKRAEDCWPADAGIEGIGGRKVRGSVKKAAKCCWPVKPEGRLLVGDGL